MTEELCAARLAPELYAALREILGIDPKELVGTDSAQFVCPAEVEQAVAEMHIPDAIHADFAGDVQAFKQAVGAQPLLLLAA